MGKWQTGDLPKESGTYEVRYRALGGDRYFTRKIKRIQVSGFWMSVLLEDGNFYKQIPWWVGMSGEIIAWQKCPELYKD